MLARWRFHSSDFPSMQAARVDLLDCLRANAAPDADFYACALAFGEIVANAMTHAPPGELSVELDWTTAKPELRITDCGGGFSPNPALPDAGHPGGRGIFIVSKLAGPVRVEKHRGGGCTVCVELPATKSARR